MMKPFQKSKRVSWAPDFNLCQVQVLAPIFSMVGEGIKVKFFSSEDCPSKVGREAHDRPRAKASRILHSNGMDSKAPPGFLGGHNLKYFKEELSCIPQIKWHRPPKVVLSDNWHVAAGEESKEAEAQTLREMRVLEAVYPRLSAIPLSPTVSLDVEEYIPDDCHTPLIPITPVEEDDATHLQSDSATPANTSLRSQSASLPRGLLVSESPKTIQGPPTSEEYAFREFPKADVNAAASAAFAAILKSNEQGSLIDTDLLIKILSNPDMIEKLLQSKSDPKAVILSLPMSMPAPDIVSSSSRLTKENSDYLQNLVQPTLNITPPKQTVSSFSFCSQEMNSFLPPKQSIGNSTLPNRTASLVPLCSQEPNMFFPPRPAAIGNSIPSTGQVASSSSAPYCIQETNINFPPKPAVENLFSGNAMIPQPNIIPFSANNPSFHVVKDMNYYKGLIQQHGGQSNYGSHNNARSLHETQQETQQINGLKRREREGKIQKPCMFFNSSKGCRNGSNCQYKHDIGMSYKMQAGRVLDVPNAKKMRLGMEISTS